MRQMNIALMDQRNALDNVGEACLDFLKRMSPASEYKRLKWEFLDSIIAQKSA